MSTKTDFQAHSIALNIMRTIICLIIIKNMCFYLPMAEDLFGFHGIFQYETYLGLLQYYNLSWFTYPFHVTYMPQIYLLITALLAGLYMHGFGSRLTGALLFLSIIILKIRNGFILDGSDNVIQVILPFIILADNRNEYKVDTDSSLIATTYWNEIQSMAVLCIKIQICFVYFFTALAKLQGDLWLNGTAVYYTMRVHDFMATSYNVPLTSNHYFVVIATYFTLFWEVSFAFLIWFRKTKYLIVIGGILLHLGIWIFMRIDNFSWVMISSYFIFFQNDEFRHLYRSVSKLRFKKVVSLWYSRFQRQLD